MASKTKTEARARLEMMEELLTTQLGKLQDFLEKDLSHYRLTSAKYVLDLFLPVVETWVAGMRHRVGYDEADAAMDRLNTYHQDGLRVLNLSRRRPSERARRAAIRAEERAFMVCTFVGFVYLYSLV